MNVGNPDRLYIFGASGTGTTTLGAHVSKQRQLVHVDCDDHYWAPVDPPFSLKRTPDERVRSMINALGSDGWVLTGACNGWSAELIDQATLIVFITLPTPLRLERLARRERTRFGHRIEAGGDMHQIHKDFLAWSSGYDDPDFKGRNLAAHETWLSQHTGNIVRIDGRQSVEASVEQVLGRMLPD